MVIALSVGATYSTGCRSQKGIVNQYAKMRPKLIAGDFKTAAAEIQQAKKDKIFREEDRVMYWLNLGTVLHYAGDYKGSQAQLEKAEKAMQDLWTKSISSEASKVLISESIQDYPGEDFEKIILYIYTALNKVYEGNMQDALVEARRADEFLKKMQVHYDKEGNGGTLYRQDAFVLWLVGLLYEIEGSMNDALLAYKEAHKTYEGEYRGKFGLGAPGFLAEDIVRTAKLSGDAQTAEEAMAKMGAKGESLKKLADGQSELIIIHGSGEAPSKKQFNFKARMPDGYMLKIALPQFVDRRPSVDHARVNVGGVTERTVSMEPVSNIALRNYKHRLPAIKARAIARATIKYVASKAAKKAVGGNGGDKKRALAGALVGAAANIAAAASEQADLRAWTTLPSTFGVSRIWLPAGKHQVKVTFHTKSGGQTGRVETRTVELKKGERKIIGVRTFN